MARKTWTNTLGTPLDADGLNDLETRKVEVDEFASGAPGDVGRARDASTGGVLPVVGRTENTAANFTTINPVLAAGTLGLETDTGKFKFGDGTTAWSSLAYGGGSASATGVPTVINVKDSGAVGDGAANDRPPIQAAITAGGSRAIIYLPPGTYSLQTIGALIMPFNLTGRLTIRGAGRGATILKLSTNVPTAFGIGTPVANVDQLLNITFEDLTVDCNSVVGTSGSGVLADLQAKDFNIKGLRFRRVEVINVGNLRAGAGRRCIAVACNRTDGYGAVQNTVTDIGVDDVQLGLTGGGGNTGLYIASFTTDTVSKQPNQRWNTGNTQRTTANVVFDQIRVSDLQWDSGATPTSSQTSAGLQLGGDGLILNAWTQRCSVKNSGDVGYEIDCALNYTSTADVAENSWNEGHFAANNHGAMPFVERQTYRYVGSRAIRSGANLASMAGFAAIATNGTTLGVIEWIGCVSESTAADPFVTSGGSFTATPGAGFLTQGPVRSISMRGCRTVVRGLNRVSTANSQTHQLRGAQFQIDGDECSLTIDDFALHVEGTVDAGAFTGASHQYDTIAIAEAERCKLDIHNVRSYSNVTKLNSATFKLRDVTTPNSGISSSTNDSTFANLTDYIYDGGAITDLATVANALTAVANLTTEKRTRWVVNTTGSTKNQLLRSQDQHEFVSGKPGATLTSGTDRYKLGTVLKVSEDGTSYINPYITDDGTNSYLCIDKVIAGVRTSLLGAIVNGGAGTVTAISTPASYQSDRGIQLATRLTAGSPGTQFGLRAILQKDTITADYYTSGTYQAVGAAAGANTATATLTGSDINTFGSGSPCCWRGFSWVPIDAAATVNQLRSERMGVLTGEINSLRPKAPRGSQLNEYDGVLFNSGSSNTRIEGKLRIRGCDFQAQRGAALVKEITGADATQLQSIHAEKISWVNPPAPAAIVPGASPYTYTNQDGYTEDIGVFGGTVSSITLSHNGAAAGQVANGPVAPLRLDPGDTITVTYSVAPTMEKVPVG